MQPEEEWRDCDKEFFRVIHDGLTEWLIALGAGVQHAPAGRTPAGAPPASAALAMQIAE